MEQAPLNKSIEHYRTERLRIMEKEQQDILAKMKYTISVMKKEVSTFKSHNDRLQDAQRQTEVVAMIKQLEELNRPFIQRKWTDVELLGHVKSWRAARELHKSVYVKLRPKAS